MDKKEENILFGDETMTTNQEIFIRLHPNVPWSQLSEQIKELMEVVREDALKADRTDAVMTGAEGFKRGWNEGETHTNQKADDAFRAVFDKVEESRKAHKSGCIRPTCNPTIAALYAEFIAKLQASESLGTAQSGANPRTDSPLSFKGRMKDSAKSNSKTSPKPEKPTRKEWEATMLKYAMLLGATQKEMRKECKPEKSNSNAKTRVIK